VEAVFIVIALVGTLVRNDGLKLLFQRPRPGFDWAEVWPETGFPSGHSMNSFVDLARLVIWRLGDASGDPRPRDPSVSVASAVST
jgi:membrane-associated phospholipid phosphatase